MRIDDMKEMSDVELEQQLDQTVDELFQLRMRAAQQELENPMRISELRRDIARMKTLKREREIIRASAEES